MTGSFKVSKISGQPQFDALPIVKITSYPLEKLDYKPYAQCILCVGEESLTLRMWAFEVSPLPASSLRSVLYIFRDHPEKALCADIFSTGHVHVGIMENGEIGQQAPALDRKDFSVRELSGEDLQGVFWGNTVSIPLVQLQNLGGALELEPGDAFPGNFYKLCNQEPFIHSGSSFAVDFTTNPYTKNQMGRLQVVAY